MKELTVTEDGIKKLVDNFYDKIRQDKELGPVFNEAIGYSNEEWVPHLEKMYAFWSSVMLTSGRYHGNPLKKHKDLPPFNIELFGRWLELFAQTAQELFSPEIAEAFMAKSQRIAANLKFNLYFAPPTDFPIVSAEKQA